MVRLLVAALFAIAAFGGCTLFDDDPPANTCKNNLDCFRAQGETCNTTKHVCETTVDAGVDSP